jgi:hypothetical protein
MMPILPVLEVSELVDWWLSNERDKLGFLPEREFILLPLGVFFSALLYDIIFFMYLLD